MKKPEVSSGAIACQSKELLSKINPGLFVYNGITCDFKQCSRKLLRGNTDWKLIPNILWERLPHSESNMPSFDFSFFLQRPQIQKLKHHICHEKVNKNCLISEFYLKFHQLIASLCSILPFCFCNILPDNVSCENKYIFLWLVK